MLDSNGDGVNYFVFKGATIAWCVPCTKLIFADWFGVIAANSDKKLVAAVLEIFKGVVKAKGEGRIKFIGKDHAELQV